MTWSDFLNWLSGNCFTGTSGLVDPVTPIESTYVVGPTDLIESVRKIDFVSPTGTSNPIDSTGVIESDNKLGSIQVKDVIELVKKSSSTEVKDVIESDNKLGSIQVKDVIESDKKLNVSSSLESVNTFSVLDQKEYSKSKRASKKMRNFTKNLY